MFLRFLQVIAGFVFWSFVFQKYLQTGQEVKNDRVARRPVGIISHGNSLLTDGE